MIEIPLLSGDGIGPEIAEATVTVVSAACAAVGSTVSFVELPCGLAAIESHGTTMPPETLARLDRSAGWILGPLSTHRYAGPPDQPNVSALLRRRYDLHANIRPVRTLVPGRGLVGAMDLVVVRENTQGFYADRNLFAGPGEFMVDPDTALALRVITRSACTKVAVAGFAEAEQRQRRVTLVHKANVLHTTDGLFLEACRAVADQHPDVAVDDVHVDAAATALVTDPGAFDVIVTTNMFGDILSNEAAGLVGGLGLAPSLNQSTDHAMAQASHGSAPTLAGTGRANPVALILSAAMLLGWLARHAGEDALERAASAIDGAVGTALRRAGPRDLTPDLGGTGTTKTVTDAILATL